MNKSKVWISGLLVLMMIFSLAGVEVMAAAGKYRPAVRGVNGMVSAGHPLVAEIALQVLKDGGNAVDAGIAALLGTCVMEHTHHSLGGESPILIYDANLKKTVAINGVGPAPKAATEEFFITEVGGIPDEDSILNAPVPGTLDAMVLALDKFGTMDFATVCAPAIEYAEDGFPIDDVHANWLKKSEYVWKRWPSSAAVFAPGGKIPKAGEIWKQPNLSNTLRRLVSAETENATKGRSAALKAVRDEFYKGSIAQELVKFMEENGGLITMEDLAEYEAKIEEPWKTTYREYEVFTNGTYTQSPAILQSLNILEGFDLAALKHNSPEYIHLVGQAFDLALADRHAYYGDPDFVDVPRQGLLSKEYAAERRKLIDLDHAVASFPPGDAWKYNGTKTAAGSTELQIADASNDPAYEEALTQAVDTIYLCVIDKDGNMFSTTSSNNMGPQRSGVVPGELGFVLSGRLRQFSLDPENPNYIEPGKKPRITPCPVLVLKNGEPFMAYGTPGEDVQIQVNVQNLLNVVEFGMDPQVAVEAPRFRSFAFPASQFPQSILEYRINVEERLAPDVLEALKAMGHDARTDADWAETLGGAGMIVRDPVTHVLTAGADPRRANYAMGW